VRERESERERVREREKRTEKERERERERDIYPATFGLNERLFRVPELKHVVYLTKPPAASMSACSGCLN
jgi:hypothetical protein